MTPEQADILIQVLRDILWRLDTSLIALSLIAGALLGISISLSMLVWSKLKK